MKIDFTRPLMTIKGVPLKMSDKPDAKDMTLEDAAISGLFTSDPEKSSSKTAADAFKLALRISNNLTACEISTEEISQIKEGVGRAFNYAPNVCGPVELLLEGDAHVKED